jgi:hypothetical protein
MGPALILGASLAMTAAGTGLSAASTIAGGNATKSAMDFQARQARANEGSVIGASQRRMLDKQFQTKMLMSTSEARAAAGGVNASVGSPAANESAIASRGTFQSLMDLWEGQNKAVGLENQAAGMEFTGDAEKRASRVSALGTIAKGVGGMLSSYGSFAYPSQFGKAGLRYG